MGIKLKVISLTVLSCLLVLGVVMANIYYQEKSVVSKADQELETLMINHSKNIVQNVNSQLTGLNDLLVSEVSNGLKVARHVMKNMGKVELDYIDKVSWDAINQYTKKKEKVRIPKMLVGGEWLGQNSLLSVSSPVVDQTKLLVGGTATIFQRINEKGDMLRVCTNVEKLDKTRAIGTFIPAINPNGKDNPVVSALMAGETYRGKAFVVNAWYLTSYEPIYDDNNKIIGALYFGIRQEKTDVLRKGITDTILGKEGFLYVLDQKGNYIISKESLHDGQNIWNSTDEDGNHYIQEIIQKAIKLKQGEVAFQKYSVSEMGSLESKTKISAITYFEPWGWIVVTDAFENDFKETKFAMQNSVKKMVQWGVIIGAVVMAFILLLALLVSEKIVGPIKELTEIAEDISKGNLERKINLQSKDETGQLAAAFERMQASLVLVVNRAKKK